VAALGSRRQSRRRVLQRAAGKARLPPPARDHRRRLPLLATKGRAGMPGTMRWAWGPVRVDMLRRRGLPRATSRARGRWTRQFTSRETRETRVSPRLTSSATTTGYLQNIISLGARMGAYGSLALARLDGLARSGVEKGFAVAAMRKRRTAQAESWIETKKGRWVPEQGARPRRPFTVHGGDSSRRQAPTFAWVVLGEEGEVYGTKKGQADACARRFEKGAGRRQKKKKRGPVFGARLERRIVAVMPAAILGPPRSVRDGRRGVGGAKRWNRSLTSPSSARRLGRSEGALPTDRLDRSGAPRAPRRYDRGRPSDMR